MYPLYQFHPSKSTAILHRPTLAPVVNSDGSVRYFQWYPEGSEEPSAKGYSLLRLVDLPDWDRDQPDHLVVVFRDGSRIYLSALTILNLSLVDTNYRSGRQCLAMQASHLNIWKGIPETISG